MALWENIFENAANRFEAGKYISESGKQECFSAYSQSVLIPAKLVGNQLAFISVHYRSLRRARLPI